MNKETVLIFSVLLIISTFLVYLIKAGRQLQCLRLQKKHKPGSVSDFWQFDIKNKKERALRWQAFLMFPLLYPVVIEESEKQEIKDIKLKIKDLNIVLYFLLIFIILIGVYASKAYPEGII